MEFNPPPTFVAKSVATLPAVIAPDTASPTAESLLALPAKSAAVPTEFFIKSVAGPTPTCDAADIKPATLPDDSLPVIAPIFVNAVCAPCIPTTLALTCALRSLAKAVKFCAPGVPLNKLLVIADSTLEPPCTNPVTNAAAPGFNTAASIC